MKIKNNQFGDVSITWREPMSPVEVAELKEFIGIWLRGVERRAEEPQHSTSTPSE